MLIFNKKAWHYKLIIYSFGESFFLDMSEIDWRATEDNDSNHRGFKIIYKTKPKTVNLCPYCRAVVASVISLPVLWLWRKLPHKEKKPQTHEESMKNLKRRSLFIRLGAGGMNIAFGIGHIFGDQEYTIAAIQIIIGVGIIFIYPIGKLAFKIYDLWPKQKRKVKVAKPEKHKNPSLIMTKLNAEHEKICPPIFFIDKQREDNLK